MTTGIAHLVGHRFAGSARTIEHWENFLLTEATGRAPMPADLAHPVTLFHVAIDAAGVTIASLFELLQVDGPDRVGLRAYDWEWFEPLREDTVYLGGGCIVEVERRDDGTGPYDHAVIALELRDAADDRLVARSTMTWHCWRAASS